MYVNMYFSYACLAYYDIWMYINVYNVQTCVISTSKNMISTLDGCVFSDILIIALLFSLGPDRRIVQVATTSLKNEIQENVKSRKQWNTGKCEINENVTSRKMKRPGKSDSPVLGCKERLGKADSMLRMWQRKGNWQDLGRWLGLPIHARNCLATVPCGKVEAHLVALP